MLVAVFLMLKLHKSKALLVLEFKSHSLKSSFIKISSMPKEDNRKCNFWLIIFFGPSHDLQMSFYQIKRLIKNEIKEFSHQHKNSVYDTNRPGLEL